MSATVNIGTLEGLLRWKADDADLQRSLSAVAQKANISRTTLFQYGKELVGIENTYKRVAASIDPAIAATQKYDKAHHALSAALKSGLIDHQKFHDLLDKAKEKYSSSQSPLEGLISKIVKMTGVLGPVGVAGHEAAEGIEAVISKGTGFGELLASMGPLLPVVAALAVALVAVGVAFEGFEFIKEAVSEGLKLQAVIERLNDSLRNTGSYSGLSAHEIVELAGKFEFLTGRSKQEEIEAATLLTRFKNLNEEGFRKGFDVVNAYAKAMGITAPEAARKLGPVLDGNTRSIRSLREAGVDLTRGQIAMLTKMIETGHVAEYQAKVFDILHEKVGTVAGGFDKNLNRQVGRARDLFDEFKEGIAAEVIPALEDSFSALIESAGGWEQLKFVVASFGHDAGDVIRRFVYSVMIQFYDIRITLNETAIFFDKVVASIAGSLGALADAGRLIPGFGDIAAGLSDAFHVALNNANKDIHDDTQALNENKLARAGLLTGLEKHRQALEGDTNTWKGHKSAQDEVAAKNKELEQSYKKAADAVKSAIDEMLNAQERLAARHIGTEALKAVTTAQEALNKAQAAGTAATGAQRLEIIRATFAMEAAKRGLEEVGNREKQIADLFASSNKELLKQIEILTKLDDIASNFLSETIHINIDQVSSGGAEATQTTRARLDFANEWRETWRSASEAARSEIDKVMASLLTVEEKERAIADIRSKLLDDNLSEWQSFFGYLGDQFGGIFQKIHNWIGQIQQALQAAQSLKLASGGFDSGALGAAFTKYGTYAAYGFLAWVGLKIYEGWTQARTKFGEASLGGSMSGDRQIARQISQVITDLTQQVSDLALQWHLGLVSLTAGSVTIGANSDGSIIVKSLIDNVGHVFKTMSEALDYAKVQALKFATFSEQTSELVRAAILRSNATTTEGLQADIDFANRLATQNLSEIEQQFHSFLQSFVEDFRHLMTLFGPGSLRSLGDFAQLGTAAQSAIDSLLGGIQGMYDQLTGHKADQDAIDERNRVAFNAQRAIVIAQLTLLYEEIRARIAEYQVRLQILQSGVLGGGGVQSPRNNNGDPGASSKGGGVLIQDNRNPSGDAALAALLQVLDNLARAMQGLPPEIAPGGVHRGGGGGSHAAGRESVRSFIDDRQFQLSLSSLDDFHRQLAQINHDYAAQIVAAGKDKKLREQLLALQQQETDAAIKAHDAEVARQQADTTSRFIDLVSGDAFTQATKQYEDMKKEIEKAGFGADKTAEMLARLTAAEVEAVQKLSNQMFSGMLGDLSNIIADSDTNIQQHLMHNELLRAQEIINYQIKMVELRAEYEILKAKGKLTQDEIDLLDKAFGWINKNANILPGGKDWVPSFEKTKGEAIFARSYADAATNLKEAGDKLKSAAESLIDYQTSLHTDASLGLVDPRTALENAKADYEADRAKALGGDAESIGKLKDFAETYRRNLIAFSPSSELTASVLSGIDATINQIRALPAVRAALSSDGQAIVASLGSVSSGLSTLQSITSAVNDNAAITNDTLMDETPDAIATANQNKQADYLNATLAAQQASAASLKAVSDDIKTLASNVLAWRTEARANVDEAYEQLKDANASLDKIANNTKHARKLAGTGG